MAIFFGKIYVNLRKKKRKKKKREKVFSKLLDFSTTCKFYVKLRKITKLTFA